MTPNVPALLRLLQRTAAAAHVSIASISFSGSSASSSSSSPTTAASSAVEGAATGGSSAQTVPVSLTFGGGYEALDRMVQSLDTLVSVSRGRLRAAGPLVGISSVSLSPSASGSSSSLSVVLSATIYQSADASSASGSTTGGS